MNDGRWQERSSAKMLNGHKARQIPYEGDRTAQYREYRRSIRFNHPVTDIDHLEYRIYDGKIIPVAVLELTRYDYDTIPSPNYFKAITDRFNIRDHQGDVARFTARKLNCMAWIVLFKYNLDTFWLYNLSNNKGWWMLSPPQYDTWLANDCSSLVLPLPM